ncbi:Ig-like domain-containing protein [Agromyces sp. S2-1-8]|uniref:Ig-like domain-containing protein n=1 Tax=Agromyces sp. S2-1-8 TaxID=2897180 RepID=UPI001E4A0B6D|nr:Ig-like domain-containing protein [Agromyces sp. S2-1-8]MCD5348392.1 Ig-like domain-containing protein [Agromyces sp. S2-1-8]
MRSDAAARFVRLSRPPAARVLLAFFAIALVFTSLLIPTAAFAAPGTVSEVTVSVAQDGSEPLVPAYDDGLHNSRVATNDLVRWTVTGNVTLAGEVTYTSTLPVGMEWDSTSTASTVCNVSGTLSADKRTWTCTRDAAAGVESFEVAAWVGSVANGAVLEPTVTAGAASGTAPGVTVVGETKTELRVWSDNFNQAVTHNGQDGASFRLVAQPGATVTDGNVRGLQALTSPLTFTISVPPEAVVMSSAMLGGSGSLQVEQAGPGQDVHVTITGATTDFLHATTAASQPATYRIIPSVPQFFIFIPNDPTLPAGQATRVTTQVKAFDPTGLDGSSNFGDGYASGQDPAYTCPTTSAVGSQLACSVWNIDRTGGLRLVGNNAGATDTLNWPPRYLLGDPHSYPTGQEKLVPGAEFVAHLGMGNRTSASESATSPRACVTFDNALLTLNGTAVPKKAGAPVTAVYSGGGAALAPADYVLEYSAAEYAGDADRRGVDCGTAGDGATGWVTDPSTLPGGMASVTSVRVLSSITLDPGVSLGLSVPFKRTVTDASLALPVDAPVPWFFQYGTAETPLVKSAYPSAGSSVQRADGGYIQAVPSLVRATTAMADASIDPGTSTSLIVRPFIIAPVGEGITTSADDITLAITLDNACVTPVPSTLDALVASGVIESYELTPADAGADGISCTADDGAPASITLALGTRAAPGGPSNLTGSYANYAGHQVNLGEFSIGLSSAPLTPSGTTVTAQTVIAATTDTSVAVAGPGMGGSSNYSTDRTVTSSVVVTGVAALTGTKTSVTSEPGLLAPGEVFSYLLTWGNGTSDTSGPGIFVDVLPFDGDGRGTLGLGSAGLVIESVTAAMSNPAVMGDVAVEYTTDAAEGVADAVSQDGNEDGHSGINWATGELPDSGVTALRFVMSGNLEPGFAGTATISLRAPTLSIGGSIINDLYGRTGAVNGDPATAKSFHAVSPAQLTSTAASLGGTIIRDLDLTGGISAEDGPWPAAGGVVEIVDAISGVVVATTDAAADGSYSALVPPGTYLVRLADGSHDGWVQIEPGTWDLEAGDVVDDFDQLYGEDIPDPVLEDDAAATHLGDSVIIDVTANDTFKLPSISEGSLPRDGVALGDVVPAHGTVELTAPAGDSEQSQLRYTPPADWPEAFADEDSFEDSFTYTWTNALGVTETATVTVTVFKALVAVDDEAQTHTEDPVSVPVLTNDSGSAINVTAVSVPTSGTAAIQPDGTVLYTPAEGFAGVASFEYTITDALGVTGTAEVQVTVWGPPQPPRLESSTNMEVPVSIDAWSIDEATGAAEYRLPATTVSVENGANGTAELLEDGTIRYTPNAGFVGDDEVTYTVRDSAGREATAVWVIHVLPIDVPIPPTPTDPPVEKPTQPVESGMASTGIDALSMLLAGGVLAGAGMVFLILRRRKTAK